MGLENKEEGAGAKNENATNSQGPGVVRSSGNRERFDRSRSNWRTAGRCTAARTSSASRIVGVAAETFVASQIGLAVGICATSTATVIWAAGIVGTVSRSRRRDDRCSRGWRWGGGDCWGDTSVERTGIYMGIFALGCGDGNFPGGGTAGDINGANIFEFITDKGGKSKGTNWCGGSTVSGNANCGLD